MPLPDKLRETAEARLSGTTVPETPARSAEDLLHELQVHQIELEMQNEALRQSQVALEESRDRYVDLYDFAPVGYLGLTDNGLLAEINLTGAALLGEDRQNLLNRRFAQFVEPDRRDEWQRLFRQALRQDGKQSFELRLDRHDGVAFDAHMDCLRIANVDAAPMLRIALTDITERKRADEALRIAAIAFESQVGMIITDPKGVITRTNQAFTRLTGYEAAEAIGRTPAMLQSGRHDKAFYQRMWLEMKEKGGWQGEVWNRRKNGKIYAEWLAIAAVTAPDGTITHYVGAFSEITANKEAEAEIHRLAYYDPLTHLPNRRLFFDRLGQAVAGSRRSERHGALLFMDLDDFKTLNDTCGHDVGDRLLIEAAGRIQAGLRESDTLARLGGDEFVVILEDLSEEAEEAAAQARLVGEKIRTALAEPHDFDGRTYLGSVSIGIGLFHKRDEPPETLFKHADFAMYQAKTAGRNALRFFDPAMQSALERRSAMEADLRLAVERGQLVLHYQAQVDGSRRVIGAEALLHWMHPMHGCVPPGDFIPLAEETGLILPIGHWVLETACARIKAWSAMPALRDLRVSVNVSARQFRQPDFVAQVEEVLARTCADPSRLKIELTESLVLDEVEETIVKMSALKRAGVGFSLDDFGTGHSSLAYLTRLPLDQLKIDKSFVLKLPDSASDAIVARTIISMALSLGLDVIAEGVETEAQRAFLERHHCRTYQGYLFGRPLPTDEFEHFMTSSG